jgi:bifunctional DNA primase/polymerase-like protein
MPHSPSSINYHQPLVEPYGPKPTDLAEAPGGPTVRLPISPRRPAWGYSNPDQEATCPAAVTEAAWSYVRAGLSVIPVLPDGSNSPDWQRLPRRWDEGENRYKATWKTFQVRRPRDAELVAWHDRYGAFGLAVVGGEVSGGLPGHGLEVIDCDNIEIFAPWSEEVERQAPGLMARLVQVQTPRPGRHLYYRCAEYGGSEKLAYAPEVDATGRPVVDDRGRPKRKTLIETKGEGGYCLVPPSPSACHPSRRRYLLAEGSPDLTQVPTITPAERNTLLTTARQLNRWTAPAPPRRQMPAAPGGCGRPGDDFDEHADWADILEPYGWEAVGTSGGTTYWRRPGKGDGVSATTGYCGAAKGADLLYVFSSNANPFEADTAYHKFAAFALLEHDGDFSAAAKALRSRGYGAGGSPPSRARRRLTGEM